VSARLGLVARRRAEGAGAALPAREHGWWRGGPAPRREAGPPDPPALAAGRYRVRRRGRERVLECLEAPTVHVHVDPDACVSAAAARSAPPGTIFLDGAAQGEPFVDAERDVYNLDHHEGCVRAFTLASCEQALVLLRRGLDLRRRDFEVHANGVDLDSVLAIWVLLNHLRLAGAQAPARARIVPLLRLEGNIDALGFGCEDLCGLAPDTHAELRRQLDALLERERQAKARGADPLGFVAAQLRAIDRIAYAGEELLPPLEIEELARAELVNVGVAVVCRADGGIYEVEQELRRLHGDRLGLVVLQKDARGYSLRAVHPAAAAQLERIYERLNAIDRGSDGARAENRWGGAGEIGGSPRRRGTRLAPRAIAAACQEACAPRGAGARARRVLATAAVAAALGGPALAAGEAQLSALALFVAGALACLASGRRAPGFGGLRSPQGLAAWAFLPLAVGAGVAGGVAAPGAAAGLDPLALAALFAAPAGFELLFRGFVLGRLLPVFPGRGGAVALALCALLSAAARLLLPASALPGTAEGLLAPFLAALVFGLAAGAARLRAESVAPPLVFACLAALGQLALLAPPA
jgi:membrane protease YdiL (CAAX protease family)